jgi:putative endopeptidase
LGIGGAPDRTNSKQTIGVVGAGALSLPDSDYYLKQDPRSQEIRDELVKHIAAMSRLLGDSQAAASSAARTVLDFETTLAKARLPIADRRNPDNTFHRMDLAQVRTLAPAFDWNAAVKELDIPASVAFNVAEPEYVKAVNRQLTETPVDTWKTWLRWRAVDRRSQALSQPFFDESFHFRQTVLNARANVRRQILSGGSEAAHGGAGGESARHPAGAVAERGLAESGDPRQRRPEAGDV